MSQNTSKPYPQVQKLHSPRMKPKAELKQFHLQAMTPAFPNTYESFGEASPVMKQSPNQEIIQEYIPLNTEQQLEQEEHEKDHDGIGGAAESAQFNSSLRHDSELLISEGMSPRRNTPPKFEQRSQIYSNPHITVMGMDIEPAAEEEAILSNDGIVIKRPLIIEVPAHEEFTLGREPAKVLIAESSHNVKVMDFHVEEDPQQQEVKKQASISTAPPSGQESATVSGNQSKIQPSQEQIVAKDSSADAPPQQMSRFQQLLQPWREELAQPRDEGHQVVDPDTGDFTVEEKIRRLKEKLSRPVTPPSPEEPHIESQSVQQVIEAEEDDFAQYAAAAVQPAEDILDEEEIIEREERMQNFLKEDIVPLAQSDSKTQRSNPQQASPPKPSPKRWNVTLSTNSKNVAITGETNPHQKPVIAGKSKKKLLRSNHHVEEEQLIEMNIMPAVNNSQERSNRNLNISPRQELALPSLDNQSLKSSSKLVYGLASVSSKSPTGLEQNQARKVILKQSSSNSSLLKKPLISARKEDEDKIQKKLFLKEFDEVDDILAQADMMLKRMSPEGEKAYQDSLKKGGKLPLKNQIKAQSLRNEKSNNKLKPLIKVQAARSKSTLKANPKLQLSSLALKKLPQQIPNLDESLGMIKQQSYNNHGGYNSQLKMPYVDQQSHFRLQQKLDFEFIGSRTGEDPSEFSNFTPHSNNQNGVNHYNEQDIQHMANLNMIPPHRLPQMGSPNLPSYLERIPEALPNYQSHQQLLEKQQNYMMGSYGQNNPHSSLGYISHNEMRNMMQLPQYPQQMRLPALGNNQQQYQQQLLTSQYSLNQHWQQSIPLYPQGQNQFISPTQSEVISFIQSMKQLELERDQSRLKMINQSNIHSQKVSPKKAKNNISLPGIKSKKKNKLGPVKKYSKFSMEFGWVS